MSLGKVEEVLTPEVLECESEEKFVKSLDDFIEHEKQYLKCPQEGPSELRYVLYRSVFNKLIVRSSSYKRILLSIKTEYDSVIRAIDQKLEESRISQDTVKASRPQPRSIDACERRAASLRDRISVLQKENGQLQQEIDRQKSLREQSMWIQGLTVAESEDLELLEKHLAHLQTRRQALLERRSQCVCEEVRTRLSTEQDARESWRDSMEDDNTKLKLLYKRLRCVYDHLCSWREGGQRPPLEELLQSVTEEVTHTTVAEDDLLSIDTELLESEEPTGVNESEYLTEYLDRFVELFDSAQYEEAAQQAAHCPRGLLRNLHTLNMFKAVTAPPDSPPPLLLFFLSLVTTTPVGQRLPESVSYEGVRCALEQGHWQLLTHAHNFEKLTSSERLGDVLTEHAQKNPSVYLSDMLLALASENYRVSGAHRKLCLSMCRRGLTHSAVELMRRSEDLTSEDYLWVFRQQPSLCLLKLLTRPEGGGAMLSVGVVCVALLSDSQLQEFSVQLLDSLDRTGPGVLEAAILQDSFSTVEEWSEIAAVCSTVQRSDLAHTIRSVLLSQSGTGVLSSDPEGALLTQHIYM
ncbi:clathrin heavy chain linker domain-containing protein 1-like [Periophthalmus magnuspinnatus]|uniref:clathrin heavy chain linker domain-containing protein 1-like n=1 Tax=Periophthalmus magnuspinnatus TaxID=409849 RepID=UPI00145A5DE2|nr:clathrin heavy chain linker domain-containing protein 1-like [Periophthalmus magnuspinnatus]